MLTEDTTFFLFAVAFIALLNTMITVGIWLSYTTSKKPYLAIACAAGAIEIARHLTDYVSGSNPGSIEVYQASSFLQFSSTLALALALLSAFKSFSKRERNLVFFLFFSFAASILYERELVPPYTTFELYLVSLPLLVVSALLFWRALFTGQVLSPSKIFFLVASGSLLIIRIWLPTLPIDNTYLLLYYMEYLCFSMMLTAIILYEIEYSNRKVKSLLDRKVQSEQDLQFIVDNSFDIILVADHAGLLRSWSKKAEEVFGYNEGQAIGRIHINDMFVNNFSKREHGTVDEFHERMESIDGKSFMVDVRLKEVTHNHVNYSIFVLRLIAEPGGSL